MDMELKNLIDKMCNAQYQSGFFSAAGTPLKKPSRFIIEKNHNKIIKFWKEIEQLYNIKENGEQNAL